MNVEGVFGAKSDFTREPPSWLRRYKMLQLYGCIGNKLYIKCTAFTSYEATDFTTGSCMFYFNYYVTHVNNTAVDTFANGTCYLFQRCHLLFHERLSRFNVTLALFAQLAHCAFLKTRD
jgi:hypothetical protein